MTRRRYLIELDVDVDADYTPADVALVLDCLLGGEPKWGMQDFDGNEGVRVMEVVRPE